jgi:hypothetical protein
MLHHGRIDSTAWLCNREIVIVWHHSFAGHFRRGLRAIFWE